MRQIACRIPRLLPIDAFLHLGDQRVKVGSIFPPEQTSRERIIILLPLKIFFNLTYYIKTTLKKHKLMENFKKIVYN